MLRRFAPRNDELLVSPEHHQKNEKIAVRSHRQGCRRHRLEPRHRIPSLELDPMPECRHPGFRIKGWKGQLQV
jgi:hypothetical protein